MTSWATSHSYSTPDTDQASSWSATQYVRQNAFTEQYNDPFDLVNSPRSGDSSNSSYSPRSSNFTSSVEYVDISNIENEFPRQPLGVLYQRRYPLPENTADYDEPRTILLASTPLLDTPYYPYYNSATPRTTAASQSQASPDPPRLALRIGLGLVLFSFIVYQTFPYCVELQVLPAERLCTGDPDAPTYVWIPVFQWSSCQCDWTALLFITIIAVLCWLLLKGRS
ncbi:unnamed protein product [Absidia cylindrospora]